MLKRAAAGLCLYALMAPIAAFGADKLTAPQLIALTKSPNQLAAALIATLGEEAIKKGTAVLGYGPDFIWAVESSTRPLLFVNEQPGPAPKQIPKSKLWYAVGKLAPGTSHQFEYRIDGNPFGGKKDVPAYRPESYAKPGVPAGTLSEKLVHTSKIYDGMKSNYWIYVPAGYDPKIPAALLVVQDGQSYNKRDGDSIRLLDTLDNLIREKKIPLMITVFIQPGEVPEGTGIYKELVELIARSPAPQFGGNRPPGRPRAPRTPQNVMRSAEYDTVSDRYPRFLRDDLLPEVYAKYNIRRDAYSRAITGLSSGAICAFNVAWQQPDQFSRVLSWIGSFTPLQPVPNYGGQAYPAMVQRESKRNIRVWSQDGAEDQGNWPLQNLALANSLKQRGYDFHFSFGVGTHNPAQGSAELPQSLEWLWRGYDPARTEQVFVQDPAEAAKPMFRVKIYNRDHGAIE